MALKGQSIAVMMRSSLGVILTFFHDIGYVTLLMRFEKGV